MLARYGRLARHSGDWLWRGPWAAGQGESKHRALTWIRLGLDAPVVALDDPLYGGQADANPGELLMPVHALERLEQLEQPK